jgi:DNA-binding transcriptional LysR family regulator
MDRLDELTVFVTVLESGSLASAGRKLRRSPPAVTRALNALEARVGVRLVERTTRRLAATEEGRRFAEQARRILADYDDAARDISGGGALRGTIRITAPLVFGRRHVTPIVTRYLEAHPGMRVELILDDRNLDLVDEELDVGIRIGTLTGSGLVARRVGEVRRLLIASPAYVARRGLPKHPKDLLNHDLIYVFGRPQKPEWRFRGAAPSERVVRLQPCLAVNEIDAMLLAVGEGRGIGRAFSYQVADEIRAGRLVRILREFEPPPSPVQIVVPSNRHAAARVRAFVDLAAATLSRLKVIRSDIEKAP